MKRITVYLIIASFTFGVVGCGNGDANQQQTAESKDAHANHKVSFNVGPNYADSVNDGTIPVDTLKPSVHRVTMNDIGDCHIHIEYGSPGVRGRSIWGGLVAFDEVWVAGAHNATSVRFSKPVEINGKRIEAGTYAFFAIPGKDTWTLILNARYKQHLADEYKVEEDLVRINVTPETIDMVQRLTYIVEPVDKSETTREGYIAMLWETVLVKMPFKVLP